MDLAAEVYPASNLTTTTYILDLGLMLLVNVLAAVVVLHSVNGVVNNVLVLLPQVRGEVHENLVASEEQIDLLEGELGRLGVEEIDDGHEAGVEHTEVNIGFPPD